jgi:hypothetical protein
MFMCGARMLVVILAIERDRGAKCIAYKVLNGIWAGV